MNDYRDNQGIMQRVFDSQTAVERWQRKLKIDRNGQRPLLAKNNRPSLFGLFLLLPSREIRGKVIQAIEFFGRVIDGIEKKGDAEDRDDRGQ